MHLANEFLDHFLSDFEVGNDAVAQGSDRLDVSRRTAQHLLGFVADGEDLFLALGFNDRNDRGLVQNDVTALHIDQRVRCSQVDSHIGRKRTHNPRKHISLPVPLVSPRFRGPGSA